MVGDEKSSGSDFGITFPRRRPWLLVILLLLAAYFFWKSGGCRWGKCPLSGRSGKPAAGIATNAAPAVEPAPDIHTNTLREAQALLRIGKTTELLRARDLAYSVLDTTKNPLIKAQAEGLLGAIQIELMFKPHLTPEKVECVVGKGDSLDVFARKNGTTVDLIQLCNGIKNPNLIKPGARLRVQTGKFEILVSKTTCVMTVTLNGRFFKKYPVGIGAFDKTPEGTFEVVEKQKEPVWWPQGRQVPYGNPENILGTRWMSLRTTGDTPPVGGYGIHGTWDDSSIGKASSAGCVRLHNKDVEELFVYIPRGTAVRIAK